MRQLDHVYANAIEVPGALFWFGIIDLECICAGRKWPLLPSTGCIGPPAQLGIPVFLFLTPIICLAHGITLIDRLGMDIKV